jgi:hypothetical protein
MPYNDEYNRKIARDTNYINKKFIEHTDALGTSQTINYRNPSVSGSGFSPARRAIGGGVGCAEFNAASASKHEKGEHSKCPCGGDEDGECMCGKKGGTNLGFKSKDPVGVSLTGGAILGLEDNTILGAKTPKQPRAPRKEISFGSLGQSLASNLASMAPAMPSATAVRSSAIKDPNSPIETTRGRGRPRKTAAGKDKAASPMKAPSVKQKTGGNGFASGTHMDTGEGPATLGVTSRKTRKSGGVKTTNDAGDPLLPTSSKVTVKSTAKKEVPAMTEKAQLPSSTLSGLGKKKKAVGIKKHNPRAEIVKKVMAEKGMKMIDASKFVKENGLYKK